MKLSPDDSYLFSKNRSDKCSVNIMFQSKVAAGNRDPQTTLPEGNRVRKCKTTLTHLNTGLEIRVNQPVNPVMKVNRFAALPCELDCAKV